MKKIAALIIGILVTIQAYSQVPVESLANTSFDDGDLVFVIPSNDNAITHVTRQGDETPAADHVGILHRIGGGDGLPYVIEAIGRGVCLTALDSFIVNNARNAVIVCHVPDLDRAQSVSNALKYVGRPYDFIYQATDSAIYCSELVQLSFVDLKGRPVFGTTAMSFHDETGTITPYWIEYYSRRGLRVPEGEPGSNPTQLLKSIIKPQ